MTTPMPDDDAKARAQSDEELRKKQNAAYSLDDEDGKDAKSDPLGQAFDTTANPSKKNYSEANWEILSKRLSGRKPTGPRLHEELPGVQVKLSRTLTGSQLVHVKDMQSPILVNKSRVSFDLSSDPATASRDTHTSAAIAAKNFKGTAVVIHGGDDFSKIMLLLGGKHHGMNIKNEKEILALRESSPEAWERAQKAWHENLTGSAPKASTEVTRENFGKVAGEAALAIGLLTPDQKIRNENMQHKLAAISIRQAIKNGDTDKVSDDDRKGSKTEAYMKDLTGQFRGKNANEIEEIVAKSMKENKIVSRHVSEARNFVEVGTNKLPIGVTPIAMLMLDMGFLSRDAKENLMAAQAAVRTLETVRIARDGKEKLSLPKDPNGVAMSYERIHGTAGKFAGKEAKVTTDAQVNYKDVYDLIKGHELNGASASADEKTAYATALRKHETDALIHLKTVSENLKNMGARNAGQIEQDIEGLIDTYRTPAGAAAAKAPTGPRL